MFLMIMNCTRIIIFTSILVSIIFINAEVIDPCLYNDHLTDPLYTCCDKSRYDSPEIYTNKHWIKKCLQNQEPKPINLQNETKPPEVELPHIVQVLWTFYHCLLEQAVGEGKEISFDTVREALGKNLKAEIKADIAFFMEQMKNYSYDPFPGRSDLNKSFRSIATAWNAYYIAENRACNKRGSNTTIIYWEQENNCKSWLQQNFRRGDCCKNYPIPLELFPDTYLGIDQLELKNFTANTFMSLTGTYKSQNETLISRSNIISVCRRAALFYKQGLVTNEEAKNWITTPASNSYDSMIRSIIPKYLTPLKDNITEVIKSELEMDEDIRILSNFSVDGRDFSFVNEWMDDKKFDLNGTRLLLWNCHAMKVAVTSYKSFNFTGYC